ncbi:MAG: hypothetical protein JJT77_07830 [Crocinitomicaceae bacterium]|nr:hypothetical protein [Crocinitomicaceae bacterium]
MSYLKNYLSTFLVFHLFIFASFNGWSQSNNKKQDQPIAKHIFTSSYNVAIFPASFPFPVKGERFTPSDDNIFFAERALSRDMRSLNQDRLYQTDDFLIHTRLRVFNRQYFGYINEAGEKVLIINAFWNGLEQESENAWLNKVIKGSQAPYFWSVKYNIDLNELYDFVIAAPTTGSELPSDSDHKVDKEPVDQEVE